MTNTAKLHLARADAVSPTRTYKPSDLATITFMISLEPP